FAGNAFADVSAGDAQCHAAISKNIAKYQASLAKSLAACHKKRIAGKIDPATNCNDVATRDLQASGGKETRTSTRADSDTATNNGCVNASGAMLPLYPRCPSPAAASDDGGTTDGIDSSTELATCLLDLSEAAIDRLGISAMGTATTLPTLDAANVAKCQGNIGKGIANV